MLKYFPIYTKLQTVQAAPYNTRSAQVPLPDARNHPIPGVRDLSLTDRFARVKRKFATKDKTFRLDAALKDETKFFETRVNHLEIFLKANTRECLNGGWIYYH
jgi:hypothetical protein